MLNFLEMGRTANLKRTGKATKPGNRKQFNASLPEQLVLDFNQAAEEQGRDKLLKDLLLGYLEKSRPTSKSVLQFRSESESAAEMTGAEAMRLDQAVTERKALKQSRHHAEKIVEVTTEALMRKGPKRVTGTEGRQKRRRVS
jgi:metal-responsive CopG/Arc/MetJ family transcriptional regulator